MTSRPSPITPIGEGDERRPPPDPCGSSDAKNQGREPHEQTTCATGLMNSVVNLVRWSVRVHERTDQPDQVDTAGSRVGLDRRRLLAEQHPSRVATSAR